MRDLKNDSTALHALRAEGTRSHRDTVVQLVFDQDEGLKPAGEVGSRAVVRSDDVVGQRMYRKGPEVRGGCD